MDDLCIHEMLRETCSVCAPWRGGPRVADTPVLISPSHVGHLDGCFHKGDDDTDYRSWGVNSAPGAWRSLVNGNTIVADGGAQVGLEASRACSDCVGRALG